MVFRDAFWHDLDHTHVLHAAGSGELDFPWWIDMQRTHGVPALVAFNGGPFANRLHAMTPAQRLDLALDRLSQILGRRVPRPTAWMATDWEGDPYSCGSYSALLVGQNAQRPRRARRARRRPAAVRRRGDLAHAPRHGRRRDDHGNPRGQATAPAAGGGAQRELRASAVSRRSRVR